MTRRTSLSLTSMGLAVMVRETLLASMESALDLVDWPTGVAVQRKYQTLLALLSPWIS